VAVVANGIRTMASISRKSVTPLGFSKGYDELVLK